MENIIWGNLLFDYFKTDFNIRCYFRNGKWGKLEISSSEYVNIHIAATGLHYGQEAFEGMKAFRGKDDKVRIFRWEENANRLKRSAVGIQMAELPSEIFKEAVWKAIRMNERYIPPYGSEASLYVRPVLFGTGAAIGVRPANEYLFIVFVTPVGPYFKGGIKPVDMMICRDWDRAAPLGTGHIKVGGNYAASLLAMHKAKQAGYVNIVFLDAKEKKYIDECGPANFFAIKDSTYITPDSHSILPSITNMSLMQLAKDMGMKTEKRKIPVEELDTFEEVGACGTAAVISPIKKIVDIHTGKIYEYCKDGLPGPISMKLYHKLQAIQCGDEPDLYHWIEIVI
jgi:branched-chain amino acid aminotransferase